MNGVTLLSGLNASCSSTLPTAVLFSCFPLVTWQKCASATVKATRKSPWRPLHLAVQTPIANLRFAQARKVPWHQSHNWESFGTFSPICWSAVDGGGTKWTFWVSRFECRRVSQGSKRYELSRMGIKLGWSFAAICQGIFIRTNQLKPDLLHTRNNQRGSLCKANWTRQLFALI